MQYRMRALAAFAVFLPASAFGGAIIHVDDTAVGANDGSSWCNAFVSLQDALAGAGFGDTVRVAQGVYKPDQGAGQTAGDRTATFQLINGVAIEGGYAGCGAPDPDARDIETYETFLSGDLSEDDLPGFGNIEENSYHVVTGDGVGPSAALDGVTIRGGNADDGVLPHDAGGGMRTHAGAPSLTDCLFKDNSATFGGGMENFNGGNPLLTRCTFIGNRATFRGGGVHNNTSNPTLIECSFRENVAVNSGGGMRSWNFSSVSLIRCEFIGNQADFGGGMVNDETFASLRDCSFIGNVAADTSGGMHNWLSHPLLVNCLFVANTAGTRGGGIYSLNESEPTLINCTLGANVAGVEGGALYAAGSAGPQVFNSVIWDNPGGSLVGPGTFTVAYSNVEGGWPGAGNIDEVPDFVNLAGGDLRLGQGSPCIDAADNTAVGAGVTTDLAGEPRFVDDICTPDTGNPGPPGPIVDMGAYEFQGNECCDDEDCDNGQFCDGAESCDAADGCHAGADPCPGLLCNEQLAACVECLVDADCDDGDPCNGSEACASGTCAAGEMVDCNHNQVEDACDIEHGNSLDVNENGVPDECEAHPVPAVSHWGLVILALLLLVVAKGLAPTRRLDRESTPPGGV